MVLVAIEDLVAGLAGNAELTADKAHRLAFQQASHERRSSITELSFHGIDTFPLQLCRAAHRGIAGLKWPRSGHEAGGRAG